MAQHRERRDHRRVGDAHTGELCEDGTLGVVLLYGPGMTTPERERAVTLARLLRSTTAYDLPSHVAWRLATLVGDSDVRYAEAAVSRDAQFALSGLAVVLTDRRVLTAQLDGTKDARQEGTVTVRSWGRSELSSLSLIPDGGAGLNDDATWREDWGGKWPVAAALSLEYRTGDRLRLPMQPESVAVREAFAGLLPSLLADLDRS